MPAIMTVVAAVTRRLDYKWSELAVGLSRRS